MFFDHVVLCCNGITTFMYVPAAYEFNNEWVKIMNAPGMEEDFGKGFEQNLNNNQDQSLLAGPINPLFSTQACCVTLITKTSIWCFNNF